MQLAPHALMVAALIAAVPVAARAQTIADPTPPAFPLKPFFGSVQVLNAPQSVGAVTKRLGITNITLTNFDNTAQQVFIFAPVFASGGKCGDPVQGGASPRMQVYVQPTQTLVIPYPTPLVFSGLQPNCIAAEVTTTLHGGSVEMDVTGYTE